MDKIINALAEAGAKIMEVASPKRLLMLALFLIIVLFGYIVFKNQEKITTLIIERKSKLIEETISLPSEATQAALKQVITNDPLIAAGEIVDVDMPKNTRTSIWFFANNDMLINAFGDIQRDRLTVVPWIDNDPRHIAKAISLINGTTGYCINVEESTLYTRFQAIAHYAKMGCTVPIPAFKNQLTGYFTMWFKEPLLEDQQVKYLSLIANLTAEIGIVK